jgi:hypothetical protein
MAKLTRRGFIRKTSVGAATLGALVAVPRLAEVDAAPQPHAAGGPTAGHHEPLLAHVRNRASGEIALLVGTREVVIHDRELVMRLVKAAQ